MKTFDDFPECVTSLGQPPIEEDGRPVVGSLIDGKKVIRSKPVSWMCEQLIDCFTKKTDKMALNIMVRRHPVRVFVVWMVEVEL